MFFDTRRTERLTIASHCHNQLVVLHIKQLPYFRFFLLLRLPLFRRFSSVAVRGQCNTLFGIVNRLFNRNSPVLEIYIVGPSLEEVDFCSSAAHGFERGPEFQGTDCGGGKERCESKVGSWRYDEGLELE